MPGSTPPTAAEVLLLIADTGGGHRAAARAVAASLRDAYPGQFEPVLLNPLTGPGSVWLLRWLARLYGPVIRHAPWLWGAAYRAADSPRIMRALERTLLRLADRPVQAAVRTGRPVLTVALHPLTTGAAVRAAGRMPARRPVLTIVTDLLDVHASWLHEGADWIALPPGAAGRPAAQAGLAQGGLAQGGLAEAGPGPRRLDLGLPVGAEFAAGPATAAQRARLRRRLGVAGQDFLAVVTGGAEGAGPLLRTTRTIMKADSGIRVVVICGRNERARRHLSRLAARSGGRLTVLGFVSTMADWLRCADVVVTKAGPATIAEAACCGAPLLITSYLPGQEAGNAALVAGTDAGRYVPGAGALRREIARLRTDPAALAALRAGSARLAHPGAAATAAALIARLAGAPAVRAAA